jgi:hypothetical protein
LRCNTHAHINAETTELSEENAGECHHDRGVDKGFSDRLQKTTTRKSHIKDTVGKMHKQITEWE